MREKQEGPNQMEAGRRCAAGFKAQEPRVSAGVSGAGEGKGSDSPLEPLEGAQPCPHFDISHDPLQVALGD